MVHIVSLLVLLFVFVASVSYVSQKLADSVAVRLNLANGLAGFRYFPGHFITWYTVGELVRKSFGQSPSKR